MSFQYINPYLRNIYQQPVVFSQPNLYQAPVQQYPFNGVQNPISASFYNQNTLFPYSPFYVPQVNTNYSKIAQTKSPNGEDLFLYQLKNGQKVAIIPRKNEATIVKSL